MIANMRFRQLDEDFWLAVAVASLFGVVPFYFLLFLFFLMLTSNALLKGPSLIPRPKYLASISRALKKSNNASNKQQARLQHQHQHHGRYYRREQQCRYC